jgi:hypothetical protein
MPEAGQAAEHKAAEARARIAERKQMAARFPRNVFV